MRAAILCLALVTLAGGLALYVLAWLGLPGINRVLAWLHEEGE